LGGRDESLSNEQFAAVKGILDWIYTDRKCPFKRLSGFAGTGKTVVISYLIQNMTELFPSDMKFRNICICTFTWKAALVLRERGVNACSIHSVMYDVEVIGKETVFVRRDPALIREDFCMFIVDEASMVDSTMRRDLESVGLPVLYVGDSGQLI
jgi:ATP-dependent exoDNAse (exonuclease V) alpha subunit